MGGPMAPPSAAERLACVAPVLCLQPMTAADARYQEGRREGLLEAAAMLRGAARLLGGSTGANALRCGAEEIEALAAKVGEP